jgi:two-component system response regulator
MDNTLVLLVEDDPNDEELIMRTLKAQGIGDRVRVTRNGREALDFLFSIPMPPRLILLDLKLPKMGGLEVLQALRVDNRTRLTPVVIFTSSVEQTDVVASYDLGANSYVRKPVDYKEFSDALRQIVAYWLGLNLPMPDKSLRA